MNNDLVSRKWLTDAIRNRRTYLSYEDAKDVIDLIDNAPTVELTELCKGCQYLKDCETCEEKLRPQGEWLKICDIKSWQFTNEHYECDKCHYKGNKTNFCPNCGADMRGEDNG